MLTLFDTKLWFLLNQPFNNLYHQKTSVDIGTYDQSAPRAYPSKEETNGYRKHHSFSGSIDGGNIPDDGTDYRNYFYFGPNGHFTLTS